MVEQLRTFSSSELTLDACLGLCWSSDATMPHRQQGSQIFIIVTMLPLPHILQFLCTGRDWQHGAVMLVHAACEHGPAIRVQAVCWRLLLLSRSH